MPLLPHLLDPLQAARILKISSKTVLAMARAGELPAIFLPDGSIRFDEIELVAAISKFQSTEEFDEPTPFVEVL